MSDTPGHEPPRSFVQTLSLAIAQHGATLDTLSSQLRKAGAPVSAATLSYWQTGRSAPSRSTSLRALVELEGILGVEPGTLLCTLGPGVRETFWLPAHIVEPQVNRHLERMGLASRTGNEYISLHEHWRVRDKCRVISHEVRMVLRACSDGRLTFPLVLQDTCATDTPRVRAGFGIQIPQEVRVPETGLYVGEVEVIGSVAQGDLVPLSFTIEWGEAELLDMQRHLAAGARMYVMTAAFEGELPENVAYTYQPADPQDPLQERILPVRGNCTSHAVLNPGAGTHSFDWSV